MTRDPRSLAKGTLRPRERERPVRPDLLRRAAAALKDLFAEPDADLPISERGKARKQQDGVFQPPRY